MARRRNEDLAEYRRDISRSAKWRENEGYDDLWRWMIVLYAGKHYGSASATDRMVINMAKATVDVIAPSVAVNYPKVDVEARKPDHANQAVIVQELVNYPWRV